MKSFTILADESWLRTKDSKETGRAGHCLKKDTIAFYNQNYMGGGKYREEGSIENMIVTLKGDGFNEVNINSASNKLQYIIVQDLSYIMHSKVFGNAEQIRVCVVPRAKRDDSYHRNPKLFRETIQRAIYGFKYYEDGVFDIERHTNTITTHFHKNGSGGGDGEVPYCGITKETCNISNKVAGRKILLIDDIYTKGVGIDEDAIQALYDNGAEQVVFYSVGKTI